MLTQLARASRASSIWRAPSTLCSSVTAYAFVASLCGSLLLLAAFLKLFEFLPRIGQANPVDRLVIPMFVLEAILGLWMILGFRASVSRVFAIVMFAVLSCNSIVQVLSGAVSCGCFGDVKTSPAVVLFIDMAALGLLLRFSPIDHGDSFSIASHWRTDLLRILSSVLGAFAVLAVASTLAGGIFRVPADGTLRTHAIVLDPSRWIGQAFPLAEQIDIPGDLTQGDWIVCIYQHSCSRCLDVVGGYLSSPSRAGAPELSPQIALVQVPPYGRELDRQGSYHVINGKLRDRRSEDWVGQFPIEAKLSRGKVTAYKSGLNTWQGTDEHPPNSVDE